MALEAYEFTKESEPESICRYFREKYTDLKVILTLGKEGCIYSDNEKYIKCPACKVDVNDTTAAGDTFLGYYIYGISKELNINDALKCATIAAAIAVSRPGAASSIPTIAEVEEKFKMFD